MSVRDDEPLSKECANCPVIAFKPKACAVCGPFTGKLCSDCRKECPTCGEAVCYDHWADSRGTCTECEAIRYRESGEEEYDYRSWARSGR